VITEKQIPSLFIRLDAPALQRCGQVEHHHVRLVVSKDGGNVVLADRLRPCFEKRLDPVLFGADGFCNGFDSLAYPEDER
jgi:hypothetical protein